MLSSLGAAEGDEEAGGFDKYVLRLVSPLMTGHACELPFVLTLEVPPPAAALGDASLCGRW